MPSAPILSEDAEVPAMPFRGRVLSADGQRPLWLAGWLTPYDAETIGMVAKRMGLGARLELTLAARVSERTLGTVRRQFQFLEVRGVEVRVKRADPGAES